MSRHSYLGIAVILLILVAASVGEYAKKTSAKSLASSVKKNGKLEQAHPDGGRPRSSKNAPILKNVVKAKPTKPISPSELALKEKLARVLDRVSKGERYVPVKNEINERTKEKTAMPGSGKKHLSVKDKVIKELLRRYHTNQVIGCMYDEFTCANDNCIPASWECDDWDDCGDNSDELSCGCGADEFTCANGECIISGWECDDWDDCGDNSDEISCECGADEFTCANGNCITDKWECDDWDDCGDYSDESSCGCPESQVECNDGSCIYSTWQCDGEADCADGSDEIACELSTSTCSSSEFQCNSGTCIYDSWQCDGEEDCYDGSDELGCEPTPTPEAGCTGDDFRCTDGSCIPSTWLCDGFIDCSDEVDEEGCAEMTCGTEEFTCASNGACFPGSFECDGYDDCSDGSDEANCGGGEGWSEWTDWGECNVNCGTGEQSRSRHCLNAGGVGCSGDATEYKLCHLPRCYPEATTGCGTRKVQPRPRIVGGEDALPGEWPWQVMLFYIPGDSVYCGGTLVGPKHVVSAAHCFQGRSADKTKWIVILGKYWTDRNDNTGEESLEFTIKTLTVHAHYDVGIEMDNDIALLELDGEAPVTDSINYACLDTEGTARFDESSYCFVTGWGYTSGTVAVQSDVLQEALVPLIPHDNCVDLYGNEVSSNMMCAGYQAGGIDSCQGDSGGPLVCMHGSAEDPGRWYLVGVVSWGIGCAEQDSPGVYTVVRNYFDWLRSNGGIP